MVKGIGVDIVDIARIKRMVERGDRFIDTVFSEPEIAYCRSKHSCEIHFAARFAAKEAFFKALGTGWRFGMRWDEVSISNDDLGKPSISLSGTTHDFFAKNHLQHIHLSISHTKTNAVAFVVVE